MSESRKAVPIRADVKPTEASARTPPAYANALRIANDVHGFTLTFFATPADPSDLQETREQLQKLGPAAIESGAEHITIAVHLDHVAKIFIPAEVVPNIIEILGMQYARHLRLKQEIGELNATDAH